MRKLLRGLAAVVAAAVAASGHFGPASAAGKPKIIEVPQKRPPAKPSCTPYAPRLDGEFRQVLTHEIGGIKDTHTTEGKITWVLDDDSPGPIPNSSIAPDGRIGSTAWRDFHAKARCPVQTYRISAGELTVETDQKMEWASCKGKGTAKFDAIAVLADYSSLYVADGEYMLTLAAPDYRMGRNTVSGECHAPKVGTYAFAPVDRQTNQNFILILDRRGSLQYGVHGKIDPPIPVLSGQDMLSAIWHFADPAPNR